MHLGYLGVTMGTGVVKLVVPGVREYVRCILVMKVVMVMVVVMVMMVMMVMTVMVEIRTGACWEWVGGVCVTGEG